MSRVLLILQRISQQKDLLLVLVFATILVMMILPLPTMLMDLLITLNISAGIIVLLVALHLHTPVQFSTFPAVLLITTLFRLAISISTTRLILIEGDAGKIVETFGKVVVSGNLVVGMVIFLIITVVQFLVITKGADRVAEVGARFTLDGMPGKQMSVDADVRAGSMDQIDAQVARRDLEREAKLFGAMDGAMKFVKGDAIAGLVITAINLLGGITIGMFQMGMGFSDALSLYALLTIGDGLVAQIPALLISVAAGTIVTRVSNPVGIDLGSEISQQVTENRRTIMSAGLVIAAFGFVPGFPTFIFVTVGLAMFGWVWWLARTQLKEDARAMDDWISMRAMHARNWEDVRLRTGAKATVNVKLPAIAMQQSPQAFRQNFVMLADHVADNFGIQPGYWTYEIDNPDPETYEVHLEQEVIARGKVQKDCVFVKANVSYLVGLGIPVERDYGTNEGVMVHKSHVQTLEEHNILHVGVVEHVLSHMVLAVIENLALFSGFQRTSILIKSLSKSHGALVSELRENLTVNQISAILQMLLEERIPIKSLVRILEAILNNASKRDDPNYVLQQVRVALSDFISKRFAEDGFLPCVVIAPSLEAMLREGVRSNGEDSYLILDPKVMQGLIEQVKPYAPDWHQRSKDPVIIAQQDIRRTIRNLLHENGLYIPVLAYQEISPQTIIYPIGFIGGNAMADAERKDEAQQEMGAA